MPARGPVSASEARPVTSGSQAVEGVGLSPDGKWLAFDSDRNGNQDIYKISTDGGDPIQLTSDAAEDFMSSWSFDGKEIAFYSIYDGARRLQVISAEGGRARAVVTRPRNQRFPGWSPDGRSLVFSSDARGRRDDLYVVTRKRNAPAGEWGVARQLTFDGGAGGRWSPNGREIVYARPDGIWAIAPAGGAARQILRVDSTTQVSVEVLQWSPDGRAIFYKSFDVDGKSSISSVPATGCLPSAPASARTRPEGARRAAVGCTPRLLVRFDDPARQSPRPEFATDGRRLYFTLSERDSDVWVMELTRAAP